ncbi:YwqG family protein [Ureibacillus sinduriensis]|uniref:DUF1963 domain-containing protein n=1 Tax=Ureibacillus sinduriensis BLB-1 = JCM 15800 TaxID=1384057 RepID=A0A0A3HWC4_9BACL|nr:YwqG family protein [Ureibacillus sinduriensis]KGR75515.1 hypothetical protein CD33_10255 [Ureibacillus sinduriensis BLB-1 = JCM 15800]
MQKDKKIHLPGYLECFRSKIESSIVGSIWITPHYGQPSLTDSKFAGNPYLPKSHLHPKDSNGQIMHLLAQINFAQLPSIPPFPSKGLLQFFLSTKFDQIDEKKVELLYQEDFKVRYYPNILHENQLIQDFSDLESKSSFLIQNEKGLAFLPKHEPVSASDYRREKFLQVSPFDGEYISEDERTFEDIYFEYFLAAEHKIGGYPYFIEYDTRKNSSFLKRFDTLLLQIVSNDEQGIMYGDSGVIKFFINQDALRNLDFSSVYFIAEQF